MNEHRTARRSVKTSMLALVILVIAASLLIPTSIVMAGSASSSFTVKVEVTDAIGLDVRTSALAERPQQLVGQVEIKFVTHAASSQLSKNAHVSELYRMTGDEVGLPLGSSSGEVADGAVLSDIFLLVTATDL